DAWSAGEPVRISPVTIGEFAVLEREAGGRGAAERALADLALADLAPADLAPAPAPAPAAGELRLGGLVRARGFGVSGEGSATFAVDGRAADLRCEVGLLDGAPAGASARFVVTGDGRTIWDSGGMGPGAVAKPAIDIRGIERLELRWLVEPAGAAAGWADARVTGWRERDGRR
ncbi:hypothetical protein FJ250_11230, partial [bacterium]|nr:hypothetical protein [bacterium]